jgi:16S rRNA (cytosine1402-N4)-methyltransferase
MKHIPVLLRQVIEGLDIKPTGTYVDLTLGRAGHSKEIAKRLTTGTLIGVDQDEEAILESKENLRDVKCHVEIVKSNFVRIKEILAALHVDKVDGILMDLGVSSPQFDEGDRGFSYQFDAPLDMRMDQKENTLTAREIVNNYSLNELAKIFYEYGEDKYSYQIAKNIVKERAIKPIDTTLELVEIIKRSKPMKELAKPGHPAKQVFQALRIATNDELNVLRATLKDCLEFLAPKGRLAVISFHSGEDRIVKSMFNEKTKIKGNRLNIPDPEIKIEYRLITNHPLIADEAEMEMNHRSKSAKLRIIERL